MKIKRILPLVLAIVMVLSVPLVANAASSPDNCTKLTAKQIVTQMKKTTPIKKTIKNTSDVKSWLGTINAAKTKCSFYDKKYKKVYCTVEVFGNKDDAIRRAGYIDCLNILYGTLGQKEDVPLMAYQYKNVVIRVGAKMPYKRAKKYYNAMKKIVDNSIPQEDPAE